MYEKKWHELPNDRLGLSFREAAVEEKAYRGEEDVWNPHRHTRRCQPAYGKRRCDGGEKYVGER